MLTDLCHHQGKMDIPQPSSQSLKMQSKLFCFGFVGLFILSLSVYGEALDTGPLIQIASRHKLA